MRVYQACFEKCISNFIKSLFGLETTFQNIHFHDHSNEFLAKYNFSCHNDQDFKNVVILFFLVRFFVVLFTIDCNQKGIVVGTF